MDLKRNDEPSFKANLHVRFQRPISHQASAIFIKYNGTLAVKIRSSLILKIIFQNAQTLQRFTTLIETESIYKS
jgi:hypothetical protein